MTPRSVLLIFLFALALSACQTQATPPTLVPCQTKAPPVPSYPMDNLDPQADIFTKSKTALAEIDVRSAETRALRAALTSCASPPHQ